LKVSFSHGDNGLGVAAYATEWHERGGVRFYRRITVERHFTHTPMMRREVSVYRVIVTEHDADGTTRTLRPGHAIHTFADALAALGAELQSAIRAGLATKSDMERIPVA
jgi:hypothetical protein